MQYGEYDTEYNLLGSIEGWYFNTYSSFHKRSIGKFARVATIIMLVRGGEGGGVIVMLDFSHWRML